MRLGLIARADNSGLGMQTWEFYRHMEPAKTMVVDISKMNGNKQFPERYPERATFVRGIPTPNDIDEFLADLDCVFVAEAPYNFYLYSRARELGVKTAVQYNYEFFDWFSYPWYPMPDMLVAPSRWHYPEIQEFCDKNGLKHVYLHCPVDRERLPFKQKTQAKTFVHLAGKSAAYDRNGTETVIQAAKLLKTGAKILIKFQGEQGLAHQATKSIDDYYREAYGIDPDRLEITVSEADDYWQNYDQGDVMLLPRRYGGNCLPLNEALSTGMPVIMSNVSPNAPFLPPAWLVLAEVVGQFTPRTVIDIYGCNPQLLADKIDEFANLTAEQIANNTNVANIIADQISWETMKPKYIEALEGLCNQS